MCKKTMQIRTFQFNMLGVNTYLLSDEDTRETVVIDAACYYNKECEALADFIDSHELRVTHLLNTHLHFDHIFGNRFVSERYGVKPEAHPADEEWLTEAETRTRMFGFAFPGQPMPLGKYLQEGDTVTFGSHTLRCISVPGHSRGSLAFHCPEEGVLFTGDALFCGSIGRTDLPGGSSDLPENIRQKLLVLPDETRVYPGHGDATTIGEERRNNYYLKSF